MLEANYSKANDVNNVYKLNTTDQPSGTAVHKRDQDSYFNSVEHLYSMGVRSFVFTGIMPFNRSQTGIKQGSQLQAQLGVRLSNMTSLVDAELTLIP